MAGRIRLVRGDTAPSLYVSLTDSETGDPVDVSAPAVTTLAFRRSGTADVLFTLTGVPLTGAVGAYGDIDTTYTVAGSGGRVRFDWPVGALDVDPGDYEGEISSIVAGGGVRTVLKTLKFNVRARF